MPKNIPNYTITKTVKISEEQLAKKPKDKEFSKWIKELIDNSNNNQDNVKNSILIPLLRKICNEFARLDNLDLLQIKLNKEESEIIKKYYGGI